MFGSIHATSLTFLGLYMFGCGLDRELFKDKKKYCVEMTDIR